MAWLQLVFQHKFTAIHHETCWRIVHISCYSVKHFANWKKKKLQCIAYSMAAQTHRGNRVTASIWSIGLHIVVRIARSTPRKYELELWWQNASIYPRPISPSMCHCNQFQLDWLGNIRIQHAAALDNQNGWIRSLCASAYTSTHDNAIETLFLNDLNSAVKGTQQNYFAWLILAAWALHAADEESCFVFVFVLCLQRTATKWTIELFIDRLVCFFSFWMTRWSSIWLHKSHIVNCSFAVDVVNA